MNWFQRNTLLAVVLAAAGLVTLALLVIIFFAWSEYSEISSEYDEQATELKRLELAKIYPSQQNVEEMQAQRKEYAARLSDLHFQLLQMQMPLEAITPNGFQDKLRAAVSEIQKLAADNNVSLPEEFYLGFDQYQDTLPSTAAAAELSRQLDTAKLIARRLIELGINELSYITRQPLPVEGSSQNRESEQDEDKQQMTSMQTFDLGFIATPVSMRNIVNAIAQAESFVILRRLLVKNEVQVGPDKAEFGDNQASAAPAQGASLQDLFTDITGAELTTPDTTTTTAPERRLEFVVGSERLVVNLQIQIVNFLAAAERNGEQEP